MGLTTLLSGCGGGGGAAPGSPPTVLTVVPAAAVAYAYADSPTILTIRGGQKPFNVYSSNPAIISFNNAAYPGGQLPDEMIILEGPNGQHGRVQNVDADTDVTLTIRDANAAQVNVVVTVKPSSLNTTLTITGTSAAGAPTPGVVRSGTQGTVSVQATTLTGSSSAAGAPIIGRPIRFDVVQGPYQFVCSTTQGGCSPTMDGSGKVVSVTTTTDRNGFAYGTIKVDVNAPTQYATVRAVDLVSGQILTKQFVIAGVALSALPTTSTWTIGLPTDAGGNKICPPTVVYSTYFIYGGTPPYTVSSGAPLIGQVYLPPPPTAYPLVPGPTTITVNNPGDPFLVVWPCVANPDPTQNYFFSGTANILIIDAAGTVLTPNPTFVVTLN